MEKRFLPKKIQKPNSKVLLVIVLVILLIIIAYFYFTKLKPVSEIETKDKELDQKALLDEEEVLESLTAPSDAALEPSPSSEVLKSLSAPKEAQSEPLSEDILDSLSAP